MPRLFDDEKLCPDCKGKKYYRDEEDWHQPCETCNATGKVKTKLHND